MTQAEDLKGHLDGLILAVISRGPAHGYAVIEALKATSRGKLDLPEGTVYPALHRLERGGLLRSQWSEEGRRRRVYRLTARGERELGIRRHRWREFSQTVDAVLASATSASPASGATSASPASSAIIASPASPA